MWPFGESFINGIINYPLWQIAFFELCHFILSSAAASLAALLALLSISITCPTGSSIWDIGSLSRSLGPTRWRRAVICMALLSLGAGLCAHALEDLYFSWF